MVTQTVMDGQAARQTEMQTERQTTKQTIFGASFIVEGGCCCVSYNSSSLFSVLPRPSFFFPSCPPLLCNVYGETPCKGYLILPL